MSFRTHTVALALLTMTAAPAPAWAFGLPGCSNLPKYDRAVGALEGLSVCDMSVEEARRIVYGQRGGATPGASPYPRHRRHYRHHVVTPQPY